MRGKTTASEDFVPDHKVRLLLGGRDLFSLLLHLIRQARKSIHLQVYIYEQDETGEEVANALIAAAGRGVAVYVLVDGYGSQGLGNKFIKRLTGHGVHFRVFEPLFRSKHFYVGRRMHQKVLVVDARYAIVTGANIANKYNDLPEEPAWLDFALCIEGEVAVQLCRLCWSTWKHFLSMKGVGQACIPVPTAIDFGHEAISSVRMRCNDWVRHKYDISRSYRQIFRSAKREVVLLSSYFLPSTSVRRDISDAIARGIRVKLIICRSMDVPLVKAAERYMYAWLLRHRVEIYEYAVNMLHGKIATCDDEWMTLGSFNVNDLSARVSVELNLDVRGSSIVYRTKGELKSIMEKNCICIDEADFRANDNAFKRLARWLSFKTLRLVFFLGTFYMKQERRGND